MSADCLRDHGIRLRSYSPGQHRDACPVCARGKARAHDQALAVRIDHNGGATWLCHRCEWKGGLGPRETSSWRPSSVPAAAASRQATGDPRPVFDLFRAGRVITFDDVASRYLTGRGCAIPSPDADLRWLPAHQHPSGYVGPVILALLSDAGTNEPRTLHQTWLAQDGSGKAPVEKPRLLWKGLPKAGTVCRLTPDDEVTTGLAIAEGIETGLTAVAGGYPAWACIDAAGVAGFPVLEGIEALTILADRDDVNPVTRRAPGLAAARSCAERWARAGREVRIWTPATVGTDLNDLMRTAA